MTVQLEGRGVSKRRGEGKALVTDHPISFLGDVDPDTGVFNDCHPLAGESLAGRVLVFPRGAGSTVGSYVIYQLYKNGVAPSAMIVGEAEAIVAVGAIIGEIPLVDQIDVTSIEQGDRVQVDGENGIVKIL